MLPKVADPAEPVSGLLWNLLRSLRRLFYDASVVSSWKNAVKSGRRFT